MLNCLWKWSDTDVDGSVVILMLIEMNRQGWRWYNIIPSRTFFSSPSAQLLPALLCVGIIYFAGNLVEADRALGRRRRSHSFFRRIDRSARATICQWRWTLTSSSWDRLLTSRILTPDLVSRTVRIHSDHFRLNWKLYSTTLMTCP